MGNAARQDSKLFFGGFHSAKAAAVSGPQDGKKHAPPVFSTVGCWKR
jgi:hypothetical protein